jgi:outer membrane protein TolC
MKNKTAARAAIQGIEVLVAATLLGVASLGLAADSPLTLAEAQRQAVGRSRLIAAQDSASTAAREMALAAGQLPDPVVTVGINNLPINGPDAWSLTSDFMTMRSVGLMQELTRDEKRQARAQRFEREADKSSAERIARIAAIQRDTALAWLDRYYAEAQLGVVTEQSRQARLEIEAAETAYRSGRGNLAEVLGARSALVALDDRASELGRRVRAARIALARWIGDGAETPLAGNPAIDRLSFDPHTLDADIASHAEMAVLSREEDIAAADVRMAEANKRADWSVQLMYSQRGPSFSNMVSINLSVPLQWDQKNRQDRELTAKLALLDQARAEREDKLRAHTAEVRAMLTEFDNDRERIARYERELLPLASERTQATLAAYRGAKASLADVLVARRGEIDVRMQSLQLQSEAARLWAQLNYLVPADHASVDPAPNRPRETP